MILVDFDGNCDYYERTLDTPVNPENPTCSLLSYSFKVNCPHQSKLKQMLYNTILFHARYKQVKLYYLSL